MSNNDDDVFYWICPTCTLHNAAQAGRCDLCTTSKPPGARIHAEPPAASHERPLVESCPVDRRAAELSGSRQHRASTSLTGLEGLRASMSVRAESIPHWECPNCTFHNEVLRRVCAICDAAKPSTLRSSIFSADALPPPSPSLLAAEQPPQWTCSTCTCQNPLSVDVCAACEAAKPADQPGWTCRQCTLWNPLSTATCAACTANNNPSLMTLPSPQPSSIIQSPTIPSIIQSPTIPSIIQSPTIPSIIQSPMTHNQSDVSIAATSSALSPARPSLSGVRSPKSPLYRERRRSGTLTSSFSSLRNDELPQLFLQFRSASTLAEVLELWLPFQLATLGGGHSSLSPLQRLQALVVTSRGSTVATFFSGLIAASERLASSAPALADKRVLVVGAGPCGLFQAVLLALLGCSVTVFEARDSYERNNVLHIWPTTLNELKMVGIKFFCSKLCTGELHHISIKALQLALTKIALVVGVDYQAATRFTGVQYADDGWRVADSPWQRLRVDILVAADGERGLVTAQAGFVKTKFQAGPAVGVTANFVRDKLSSAERAGQETNVSSHFARDSFARLAASSGLQCENLVYFKDDTHYLVFTPRKACLLRQGVLREDAATVAELLRPGNVDAAALETAVRHVASHVGLPRDLRFAMRGRVPDLAVFDFTAKAAVARAWNILSHSGDGEQRPFRWQSDLLVLAVGDAAIAPFWPQGTGIARGFLGAMDNADLLRSLANLPQPASLAAQAPLFRQRDAWLTECKRVTPEALRPPLAMPLADYLNPEARYRPTAAPVH